MIQSNTETEKYGDDADGYMNMGARLSAGECRDKNLVWYYLHRYHLRISVYLCLIITCIAVSSCKTTKNNTGKAGVVKVASPESFTARSKFTWIERDKGKSINGTVKMQLDERIQISLVAPVLRTEAVRIEVTPSQLLLIDRVNKQYAVAPSSELKVLLGNYADYTTLQTILSEAVFLESTSGWLMRDGAVNIVMPVGNEAGTEKLVIELNRISVLKQPVAPANIPSKYEKKKLEEIVLSFE